MGISETIEYIEKYFDISGEAGRLIVNVLRYAEAHIPESEQHSFLCEMLNGTIGLSEQEIRMINLTSRYKK